MPTNPRRRTVTSKPRHRSAGGLVTAGRPLAPDVSPGAAPVAVGAVTYARHVGRIGALAVALGVGAAVATGHGFAVAWAETEPGSSDSSPAGNSPDTSPPDTSPGTDPAKPSAGVDDVASVTAPNPPGSNEVGSPTEITGGSTTTDMNFSSSGGAHTSGVDDAVGVEPGESGAKEGAPMQQSGTVPTATTPTVDPPSQTTEEPAPPRVPTATGSSGLSDLPAVVDVPAISAPAPTSRLQASAPTTEPVTEDPKDHASTTSQTAVAVIPESVQVDDEALADTSSARTVAATVLAAVISPFVLPGPDIPTQSPLLWAMLAWTRRESQRDVDTQTPADQAFTTLDETTLAAREIELPNQPPTAKDDVAQTPTNTQVVIDVLSNDFDPDGDVLTVKLNSLPRAGSIEVDKEGTFVYTPKAGFLGVDTFTYVVTDAAGNTSTATVKVTVGKNQPPTAKDDIVSTAPDTSVSIRVLANDFDPDGDVLTVKLNSLPRAGSIEVDKEGTFVYTPKAGFLGVDTFTYVVTDAAGNTSTATVKVTVGKNQPPTAKDDIAQTPTNTPVVIDVLSNDFDPDGDKLVVDIAGQPGHGKVSVGEDGKLVYTPLPGFTGKDVVKYTVKDASGEISYASVTVTVTGKEDGKWYTVGQDTTLTVSFGQGVLAGLTQVGGWGAAVTEKPSHGTVEMNEDGSFAYTPEPGFVGTDTFMVYAFSKEGGKVPITVTIEVTPTSVLALPGAGFGAGSGAQACSGNWLGKLHVPGIEWWCSFPEARPPSERL